MNPILKAFDLALDWSPNLNQSWDHILSCCSAVFSLYFNMSGNCEICGVRVLFCGPANASSHSQCIQGQQGYL